MNNNLKKRVLSIILVVVFNWCCLFYYDSIENRNDIMFVFFVGIIPFISGLFLFKTFAFKKSKHFYSKNILLFFLYLVAYFLMFRFFGKSTYYYELYTIMFFAVPLAVIGILTFYKETY